MIVLHFVSCLFSCRIRRNRRFVAANAEHFDEVNYWNREAAKKKHLAGSAFLAD